MSGVAAGSRRPTADHPEAARLAETVAHLAAAEYAGRRVGTPGGAAARSWLGSRLRDVGGRVDEQEFSVPGVLELHAPPVLTFSHRPLEHRRDFVVHPASADLKAPRTGVLVPAEAAHWRDQWVLTSTVAPETTDRARREGAAGLLVLRGVDAEGWMPKLLVGPAAGPLPVLAVRSDVHARMSGEGGVVSASTPLRRTDVTGGNVYGALRPASANGQSVLLTAHYDGVGDDPDSRLPAAADNASGVAVVLEAARMLTASLPDGPGLAVALLDAEEVGAKGAAHQATQVSAGTYVINVDGAGRLADAAAVEAGGPAHELLEALDQAGRDTGIPLRPGAVASDNRRYAAAGFAAIGLGLGVPGYHTPADTPDRVDPDTLVAATSLVVATVHHLTQSGRDSRPRRIKIGDGAKP